MASSPDMAQWLEQLQSRGRHVFTAAEAAQGTGRSAIATQHALRRQKEQGRIVSPRRGLWVVVPPAYRAVGCPDASWFVDDLMSYLGQPYYVGLLSAAALHGAAHQKPMVFQVVTDRPTRDVRAGMVVLRFYRSVSVERMPSRRVNTETGTMRIATPETTAFDLLRYQAAAGHLNNIATVLIELAEELDGRALAEVAPLVKLPDVQRLGYVLEAIGETELAAPLASWLTGRRPRAVSLQPMEADAGQFDSKWKVRVNMELDPDL